MKKFIALALALAMMVSCLVFTASADNNVAVTLQGPSTVAKDGTFQVKVRVTDVQNIVGGVQGVIDVTGATVTKVQVNPELKDWNKTADETTIYKITDNDITFASLNHLIADTYDTRVWFIIDYKATDADAVTVALKGVKVSNKEAKAIVDVATTDVAIDVIDETVDPSVALTKAGIDATAELADDQAMLVYADVKNIKDVTDIGVVFYPTSLLGGVELTVDTKGAVVANVNKTENATLFNNIVRKGSFIGALEYNFSEGTDNALKFLGTKVTARVYYKTADGTIVYASNASDDKYINNGVVSKAALNTILNFANGIENPVDNDKAAFDAAKAALNTNVDGWQANRAYVLKYCVRNAASK